MKNRDSQFWNWLLDPVSMIFIAKNSTIFFLTFIMVRFYSAEKYSVRKKGGSFCSLTVDQSSFKIEGFNQPLLKFRFYEQAIKFEKIFVVLLTRGSCSVPATVCLSKSRLRFLCKTWSSRISKLYRQNHYIKVSKFHNEFMKSSFLHKYEQKKCPVQ